MNDNKAIEQAPDLVASIRERLCLVYSAIDDKQQSDYNRNIYLDLQDRLVKIASLKHVRLRSTKTPSSST